MLDWHKDKGFNRLSQGQRTSFEVIIDYVRTKDLIDCHKDNKGY